MQTYADVTALIDDPQVLTRRIADVGEPLVDISTFPALAIDVTRANVRRFADRSSRPRAGPA